VLDATVWTGDAQLGLANRAQPAQLTYSFPSPFALWGDPCCIREGNRLDDLLIQVFGAGHLDRGREYLRQALASWSRVSGLKLTESPDDDTPLDIDPVRSSTRGDIRIGANTQQSCNRLAATFLPRGGGDIFLNAGAFFPAQCPTGLDDPTGDFVLLRNVVAHEFGHALGFFHVTPCDKTKLLEPFAFPDVEFVQTDEKRGVARNYGDRFTPNQTIADAHDFGDLTTPTLHSVIERDLSTNGRSGTLGTNRDWFRFSLSSPQAVTIDVAPTGGTYPAAEQLIACEPSTPPLIHAQTAGDLLVELLDAATNTRLALAMDAPPGMAESLTANLGAGDYLIRVLDFATTNPPAGQFVQLYDLTIRVNSALAPPSACAGIDKRIPIHQACFFIGDMNSIANEPASTLTTFDWDLDGNGSFETLNTPRPSTTYTTPGQVPVSLRVTDSNALTNIHTITVTIVPTAPPGVFELLTPSQAAHTLDATPLLTWSASTQAQSYTLLILEDTNDDGLPDTEVLNQPGISDTQFPIPSGVLNHKLEYTWSVTAVNTLGAQSATPPARHFRTPLCPGDANFDRISNFSDVMTVLGNWAKQYLPGRSGPGDTDGSSSVDMFDVTDVLTNWLNTCP